MKIIIDLRIYGPQFGGLGRYNQKLLEHLARQDKNNEYILLFKSRPTDLGILPGNFKIKIINCPWYSWREQLVIPWTLSRLKPDLVHFPHFNVPFLYRGRFVLTIHDLIMTRYPSRRASTRSQIVFHIKYWFYKLIIKSALRRASRVIAVTDYGRRDMIEYFHLSPGQAQKIKVVYEGWSVFKSSVSSLVRLPDKFFLYVGNAYPHKNLEFLIKTFKKFLSRHPDYYLILIGQKNYFYQRLAEEASQELGQDKEQIIFAGFVEDKDLPLYYRQAQAYIFPSLYEGFGLPPLEAMAWGTAVLSSQASCLPEVLGPAALYFDPRDQDALLQSMEQILGDKELRDRVVAAGYKQIKKYSWSQMAQEMIRIYNSFS